MESLGPVLDLSSAVGELYDSGQVKFPLNYIFFTCKMRIIPVFVMVVEIENKGLSSTVSGRHTVTAH